MLRALTERGIVPDMVVGASAGAVNGAWLALHPDRLEDLERVWLSLRKRGVFPGTPAHFAYNFLRHGHVHSIASWSRSLRSYFGDYRIEDAIIPLTILTVRLSDGAVMQFDRGPLVPTLVATTSLPGLFPPQRLAGVLQVDGAVVEYLPVPSAVSRGATVIYAFDCSDLPPGDGTRGLTMDRAGQIASSAWVNLVVDAARARGVHVHLLRPSLGAVYDGRDFAQTRRLIHVGFDYVNERLRDTGEGRTAS